MLVKLHSTEMTTQRLSFNPHTLTSSCFGLHILQIWFALCPILFREYILCLYQCIGSRWNWLERGEIRGRGGRKKYKVMEYKEATLLLFFKRRTICNVGSPPDNVSGVTLAGNCTGMSDNSYHCVNIYLRMWGPCTYFSPWHNYNVSSCNECNTVWKQR